MQSVYEEQLKDELHVLTLELKYISVTGVKDYTCSTGIK